MNSLVIIQARLGSERFHRKILKRIGTKKMIQLVIDRCRQSRADKVVLAIPDTPEHDILTNLDAEIFRGSELDVLSRYYECAKKYKAQFICRVTGDNPLTDWGLIDKALELARKVDYVNCKEYPLGVGCEAFSFESLACAYDCGKKPYHREHVTPYMYENNWLTGSIPNPQPRSYRFTVDEYADIRTVRNIVERLGYDCRTPDIFALCDAHPELLVNNHVEQKGLDKCS